MDNKRCEHTVEARRTFAYQFLMCDRPAYFAIHYPSGDKLACKMHATHYRKRAEKFGWELPTELEGGSG